MAKVPERPWVVLTDEQVAEIRLCYKAGDTQQQIADRFAVSQSTISLIITGRRRRGPVNTVWTPEAVELLGKMSDAALAARLGVTDGAVSAARRARGIPAARTRRSSPR